MCGKVVNRGRVLCMLQCVYVCENQEKGHGEAKRERESDERC